MRKFGPATPPPSTVVDEKWYLDRYPDVKAAIQAGKYKVGYEHFMQNGYREGRVPRNFNVDEAWYLATYPDVAEAIKSGRVKSAYDHFIQNGYGEGRKPNERGK
jgi:hypothetical protein